MTQVIGVVGFTCAHSGEVRYVWDKMDGARFYLGFIRIAGSADEYKLFIKVGATYAVVNGLVPGQLCQVVIEPCGFNNVGSLNDPVQVRSAL
jgi:hypothetical protein